MRCRVCHRQLTNAESVRKGIGPVCEQKMNMQEDLFGREKHHIVSGSFQGDILLRRNSEGRPVVNICQVEEYHSPDGFEWGYGGSGPADLALNILMKYTGRDQAYRLHQAFKWELLAGLPLEGGIIKGSDILTWIGNKTKEVTELQRSI